jgi:hypothetical protein
MSSAARTISPRCVAIAMSSAMVAVIRRVVAQRHPDLERSEGAAQLETVVPERERLLLLLGQHANVLAGGRAEGVRARRGIADE